MRKSFLALVTVFASGLLASPALLQDQMKGGEEETGPYEVIDKWPTPWAKQGYIWGSQPGIFAETPNRIFIAARGELKLPEKLGRGFNGEWGSLGQRATEPTPEMRNCIVVVDGSGKFLMAWGTRGNGPGQFSGPHGIATDRNRRVYVADRTNHRIQIFDENGKYLDQWTGLRQANDILISADQHVWVADGTNSKVLEYDQNGKLLYWWGTYGTFPGGFWELHQMSVGSDGNFYGADSFGGRTQKFRPKP